ncbi:MAG: efflux RND transporter periplasmic adaptor subunit [bacterium]
MTDTNADNVDLSALRIDRNERTRTPHRRRKWLHLLWLLLPLIAYLGYQYVLREVAPTTKVRVGTAKLLTGSTATARLVATGYVVAQVKAAVASKATGRLQQLNVEEGDKVKRGDILAVLENDDIAAGLALAVANLKAARADSTVAAQNYFRQKEMVTTGASTEDVVEAATAEYYRAAAGVDANIAAVTMAQVEMDNTYIRAPFDGTVLSKHADVGEMVAPFASASSSRGAVVTLADMSSLEVEADVSESNIHKVKPGAPCEIVLDAYPTLTYPGYVKKIVPTADRSRATVLTKIAFSEIDDRVLPEMSARVNFLPDEAATEDAKLQEAVLAVPKTAVTNRLGRQVVFRIVDGVAEATEVVIGRELGDVVEVESGLEAGAQVVLEPPGGLESGEKIEIAN